MAKAPVTHEGESYGDADDLGNLADTLRTLAGMVEAHVAEGTPLPDDLSTTLADVAEALDVWDEVVGH